MAKAILQSVLFILISIRCFSQAPTETLRGLVTDQDSKRPVPDAIVAVIINDLPVQTTTDSSGIFRFSQVPIGRFTLQISGAGYERVVLPNIVVNSGKEAVLNISMQSAVTSLKDIVVTADKNKGQALNDMAIVSSRSISAEQTNRYAGGFNDPSRILANFAGVTNSQDGGNDVIVRGNSPKYVRWRLEGLQITNPNHFIERVS